MIQPLPTITLICGCAASFLASSMSGATIDQTKASTAASSGWNAAIWGEPASTPGQGNDYRVTTGTISPSATKISPGQSVTGRVRAYSGSATFRGGSLEIPAGTEWLIKDSLPATFDANIVLNGGILRSSPNKAGVATLTGTLDVVADSYIGMAHGGDCGLVIDSTITGDGAIRMMAGDGGKHTIRFRGDLSGYSGKTWFVNGGGSDITVTFDRDYKLPETDLIMTGSDRLILNHGLEFASFTFGGKPLPVGETFTAADLNAHFKADDRFAGDGTITVKRKLVAAAGFEPKVNVAIIGDSTVSTYRETERNRGWGQMIPYFFDGRVNFDNHAKPSRSTKTFIGEGRWAKVLQSLEAGDYVLIQFGHNDSHEPGKPESTDAFGDYPKYLEQYIEDTRAKGATPILVTPMYRRSFDDEGQLLPHLVSEDGKAYFDLEPYAKAMRQVAEAEGVALVDLFAMSGEFMQAMGNEALADLLVPNDTTHWNKNGAIKMASLVCRGISESDSPLKEYLLPGAGASALSTGAKTKPANAPAVSGKADSEHDFALVESGKAATVVYSEKDAKVVEIATKLFADDVERVSGVRPDVTGNATGQSGPLVVIGTLGQSPVIDAMAANGTIDVSGIRGGWERYRIEVVDNPSPNVPRALVIAGSDRRGTAFGVFSLSEGMGVSPWYWWADVPTQPMEAIHVSAVPFTSKKPSIRYRGIFINDEDWGLQPWAAKTFEPETGDMGPKTYAKIFELLLRLKANHCWPAMHPSTKAFNHYPENKQVADDYAIVMGSSHCEPMLRNNVDEWDHGKYGHWNPVTNLQSMLDYWDTRVEENAGFENVYTVGVRGVHDSGVPGGGNVHQKRDRLEKIIGLQREMLEKHVTPDASAVPQSFVPYKEVLDIYQTGMKVPEDITLVWPDDNHGYIRQFPNAEERQRSGGSGVYYHISYWGGSHDYLWLDSTPPAHIWLEMTKSHQLGVHEMWILNVGDIKPMETGTTLSLDLAWDIDAYGPDVQQQFLHDFYTQQFGSAYGEVIAALKDEYYRLCAIRRPEHLGFNRVYPDTPIQDSPWSGEKRQRILESWLALAERTEAFAAELPDDLRPAYFQLVEYPTLGAAAMAEKILRAEEARRSGSLQQGLLAAAAFERIKELTKEYNSQNDGRWRGMMDYRPRGLPVFGMPSTAPSGDTAAPQEEEQTHAVRIDPTRFERSRSPDDTEWQVIEGLGPRGGAIAVLPHRDLPTLRTPEAIREHAPVAEYTVDFEKAGKIAIEMDALPTHPFTPQHEVLAAVSINDGDPVLVSFGNRDSGGYNKLWAKDVLRHAMFGSAELNVPEGQSTLKLWAADRALVVQGITITHEE